VAGNRARRAASDLFLFRRRSLTTVAAGERALFRGPDPGAIPARHSSAGRPATDFRAEPGGCPGPNGADYPKHMPGEGEAGEPLPGCGLMLTDCSPGGRPKVCKPRPLPGPGRDGGMGRGRISPGRPSRSSISGYPVSFRPATANDPGPPPQPRGGGGTALPQGVATSGGAGRTLRRLSPSHPRLEKYVPGDPHPEFQINRGRGISRRPSTAGGDCLDGAAGDVYFCTAFILGRL